MPTKLPWWRFYGRDFFEDEKVQMMSDFQQLVYLKLLNFQAYEGSIPALNWRSLSCLNLSTDVQRREEAEAVVMSCFVPHPELQDRLINPRQHRNIQEQTKKLEEVREVARKAGLASGVQRKLNTSSTDVERNRTIPNPIPNPNKSYKESLPKGSSSDSDVQDVPDFVRQVQVKSMLDLL
jgi:hypothetical protein